MVYPLINRFKQFLRPVRQTFLSFLYQGNKRYCPICGKTSRKFLPFGNPIRSDARCIHCNSLERHRSIWIYLKDRTNSFNGLHIEMLHVAPEQIFQRLLSKHIGKGYLTADLYNPEAMVKMDITNIQYPDNTFDVIYCSHVLEHVADD